MPKKHPLNDALYFACHTDMQKQFDAMQKKLRVYEARRLVEIITNSARSSMLYFENRNRSARIPGKFTIR